MAGLSTAELLLARMKALGVDYIFGNAGTDFPPVIEAYAARAKTGLDLPEPVLVAHETVAVGMAHGYYLATGRAQCAMVHVNVGLANTLMGLLNAATDNVPVLMASGRTPVTEKGRHGSRSRPIHWGQEMRDQSAMVREAVKWDYELRYPEQAAVIVDRALSIAASDPKGPVYLSLPREVLAEPVPDPLPLETRQDPARAGAPRPDAVVAAVDLIAAAKNPVIVAQRPVGSDWHALSALSDRFAIPVVDFWAASNVMPSDHPLLAGGDPSAFLPEADVVLAIETLAPWLIDAKNAAWDAKIVGIGPDPLFTRTPVRSFPVDIALAGDPELALTALSRELDGQADAMRPAIEARRAVLVPKIAERRAAAAARAETGSGRPMNAAWVSKCLSEAKDDDAAIFNELGCDGSVMRFSEPGTWFSTGFAGGLGWGLPAAIGFQLADRDRQVIACVGDGSYIFSNPVACHHVMAAQGLPVLTVVFNNSVWNAVKRATGAMYPDGEAAKANTMPFTDLTPAPDYAAIARAHGAFGERVDDGAALPDAIARAMAAVREQRRPALLEVVVS